MADRRGILIPLFILAFIFLSPDPARPPNQLRGGRSFDAVIAEEQHSLEVVRNSTYAEDGLPRLNLTGFEPERGYAWDALPAVQSRVQKQAEYALGDWSQGGLRSGDSGNDAVPLYHNITGLVHGTWTTLKFEEGLPMPRLNMSDYGTQNAFGTVTPRAFGRNITGDEGDLRIRFHERQPPSWTELDPDLYGNVTHLDMDLTIADHSSDHDLRLIGVYFPGKGQAVLTTTSEKFAGIFALPHLTLSKDMFEMSRQLLNESILRTIQRQIDRDTEKFNPWSPTVEGSEALNSHAECEMIVYLQQLPPSSTITSAVTSPMVSFLEKELRFPTGAILPVAPELRFSMVMFSPDCGYVIESKGPPDYAPQEASHLTGPKIEILYNHGRNHLLYFTAIIAFQLVLLMRQMQDASTPSTRSRISFYTIAMLALGDGFTFMTFLLASFFIGGLWVALMGTAFLSFVSVSFFGMRFLMDIWVVQAPERAARRREQAEEDQRREERFRAALQRLRETREAREQRTQGDGQNTVVASGDAMTTTTNAQAPTYSGANSADAAAEARPEIRPPLHTHQPSAGTLPLPVTAQPPLDAGVVPVFMPSDQSDLEPITEPTTVNETGTTTQATTTAPVYGESFGSVYTKFYLLLLFVLFLSLSAASWPAGLRRVYFTGLGLIYLSFWIPQINRNVQRNCRKAMRWDFILGQSGLRLLPFAYFYGYRKNVVFAEVDYTSLTLFAAWLWIQLLVLASQAIVGPRWFVKQDWAPPAYDYHPVLREDEEGDTMPIGFSQAASAQSPTTPSSPIAGRDRRSGSQGSRRNSVGVKETKEKGKRVFDCAICMQDLEVPIIEPGGPSDSLTGPAGLLARRLYMVTPCRHIFHSSCLEGWMKYRLQCPVCRETLPPL